MTAGPPLDGSRALSQIEEATLSFSFLYVFKGVSSRFLPSVAANFRLLVCRNRFRVIYLLIRVTTVLQGDEYASWTAGCRMIMKGRPLAKAGYDQELTSIKGFIAMQNKADGGVRVSAAAIADKVCFSNTCHNGGC